MTSMEEDLSDAFRNASGSPLPKRKKSEILELREKLYHADQSYAKRLNLFEPIYEQYLQTKEKNIQETSVIAVNYIFTEISVNMWFEALELCFICTTPIQYLPGKVLKAIVEIMLHAHSDINQQYSMDEIIDKCKQVLALHLRMHPPSPNVNIYKNLIKTTKEKEKQQKSDECIIEYCFNVLHHYLKSDKALAEQPKFPESLTNLQQMHLKIERYELHKFLDRNTSIDRIMSVLDSMIELFQFDLFILLQKETTRSEKPLLTPLLWPKEASRKQPEAIHTKITKLTKQIMEIFVYFIHLDYPEDYIKIMSLWLNVTVETFMKEYPLQVDTELSTEFYKILEDVPHISKNKVLERIQPSYMRYKIGSIYCSSISFEDNRYTINKLQDKYYMVGYIFSLIIDHIQNELNSINWDDFSNDEIVSSDILKKLSEICQNITIDKKATEMYPVFIETTLNTESNIIHIDRGIVTRALYITFEAYIMMGSYNDENKPTEELLQKLVKSLKDLIERNGPVPEKLKAFKKILSLE